jgi:ABC-type multidrug transport system ATPase subunit
MSSRDIKRQSAVGADDPFYPREGKTLTWSNVNMKVAGKKGNDGRELLKGVWGEVPQKEITAIMGPSGAGKTSLLNILAGRARSKGALTISSDVRLNNYAVDPTSLEVRKQIAFVAQDDSLQATATPREAIRFSAKLRLPRSTTEIELDTLTNKMLEALGLNHCADTCIGGPLLKGISGGERKRTSVGVELVVKPALVFLDEPTSGLDSFSATQVIELLHKVASAGSSVLFTIHQPSSEVFNAFDHLILLNKGLVMYQGSVQKIPDFFETCKHPVPANYNPADWIMTVAQKFPVDQLLADGFFPQDTRKQGEALQGGTDGKDALGFSSHIDLGKDTGSKPPGYWTQTSMLYNREFKTLARDKTSLAARFGITIFLNLLFGVIFRDVARQPNSDFTNCQSHFGALIMVQLSAMFGTAQPALFAIPEERPVFLREYSTDHYGVVSYFTSRFTIEALITFVQILVSQLINFFLIGFQANFFLLLAIIYALAMASTALAVLLGCSISDAKMAQEFLPLLFVPQMLFAGFFVAISLLPTWMQWVQYVCSLTYGVRLGLLAEFNDCALDTTDEQASKNCAQILSNVNADADNEWWYWLVVILIFAVLRLLALYTLKAKASNFY